MPPCELPREIAPATLIRNLKLLKQLRQRRREKDTAALAASIRANIRAQPELPFELRVLECLLADTVHFFEAKGARLEFLMDSVLAEVVRVLHGNGRSSWLGCGSGIMPHHVDLQRLVPIQRSATSIHFS